MKTIITTEALQAGQPRQYADSIYVYKITVELELDNGERRPMNSKCVEDIVMQLYGTNPRRERVPWKHEEREWWQPYISNLGVEGNVATIKIITPHIPRGITQDYSEW